MRVVSFRALRLPTDIVSVFRIDDAPEVLREIDLSGGGKAIYAVPDSMEGAFRVIGASFSEKIKGGVIYVV